MPTTENLVSPAMRRAQRKADDAATRGMEGLRMALLETDIERQKQLRLAYENGELLEQACELLEEAIFELPENCTIRPRLTAEAARLFNAVAER